MYAYESWEASDEGLVVGVDRLSILNEYCIIDEERRAVFSLVTDYIGLY